MKAMVYTRYGDPAKVLKMQDVPKPEPKPGEVLVKVKAAAVNFADTAFITGKPFIVRAGYSGLMKPKTNIVGADIAGIVEAVGSEVKGFQPGDEVYGECGFGSYAEYAVAPAHLLALKPKNLSFVEAATVPQAGGVALEGLRNHGKIQPGMKVLINGASGGIGSFGVQLAKYYGAEVTGVCSTSKIDMVKSLGADHVIDYKKEDFTKSGQQYDIILDIAIRRWFGEYKRALTPQGTYVMAGGSIPRILQVMALSRFVSEKNGRTLMGFEVTPNSEDLVFMRDLLEAGKITPSIGACYTLSELPQAIQAYIDGSVTGKIAVSVG